MEAPEAFEGPLWAAALAPRRRLPLMQVIENRHRQDLGGRFQGRVHGRLRGGEVGCSLGQIDSHKRVLVALQVDALLREKRIILLQGVERSTVKRSLLRNLVQC